MLFRHLANILCYIRPVGSIEDYEPVKYNEAFLDDRVFLDHYFPDRGYVRTMQLAYIDALNEIDRLKHDINQSAAVTLVNDAAETRQNYFEALKRIAELEAENQKLNILNEFYIDRMNSLGERVTAKDACRYSDQTSTGQFTSKTGASKAENVAMAAMYLECGFSEKDAAEMMGLSVGTIRNYVSQAKGHYQTDEDMNGRYVIFDSTCGMRKYYFNQFVASASDRAAC